MNKLILLAIMLACSTSWAVLSKFHVTHDDSKTQLQAQMGSNQKHELINQVINYFKALKSGARSGTLDVQIGEGNATAGTGTLTFTDAPVAAETMVIGSVTLTAVANASTASDTLFRIGTSAATAATNVASTINGNATLAAVFTASAALSVVTVTCDYKGVTCGEIATTEALTNASWGAATIEGGTEATANSYGFGR